MPIWNVFTNVSSTEQVAPPQGYNIQPNSSFNITIVNVSSINNDTNNIEFIDPNFVVTGEINNTTTSITVTVFVDSNGYVLLRGFGNTLTYDINFSVVTINTPTTGFNIVTAFPNTANLLNLPPATWGLLPGDKAVITLTGVFSLQGQTFRFVSDSQQSIDINSLMLLPATVTIQILSNGNISIADLGNFNDTYSIGALLVSIIRAPTVDRLPLISQTSLNKWDIIQLNGDIVLLGSLKPVDGSFYPERDSTAYKAPRGSQIGYYGDKQPVAKHLILTGAFKTDIILNEAITNLNDVLNDAIFLRRISGVNIFLWELKRYHSKVIKEKFSTGKLVTFDIQFAVKKLKPDVLQLVP